MSQQVAFHVDEGPAVLGKEIADPDVIESSWRGYWTCSDPVDSAYHDLVMSLSLRATATPGHMTIQGKCQHWPPHDEDKDARRGRREECLELKPKHSLSDMSFRHAIETTLNRHESSPINSNITGTISPAGVEMVQEWKVTSEEAQNLAKMKGGRTFKPEGGVDEGEDGLISVQVRYWGHFDVEAECMAGFRSWVMYPGQIQAAPPFVETRPDHYTSNNGQGNHPWKMNPDYHPFKLVFSRPRNLQAFSRVWEGHWRFESDITEYDTTMEVSVSPDGMISGFGTGHLDAGGVSRANEFVVQGCIDQSLHFTWRKIYENRFSDYRANTSDFKQQVTHFNALRAHLLAEVKFPRDVCWSVFEFLGLDLTGHWDNVVSGKMGPFRLKLPVVEVPQSFSLADRLGKLYNK